MKYIIIIAYVFLCHTLFSQTTFTYDASGNRIKKTITASGLKTYYQDADNDGYGNNSIIIMECNAPSGYVSNGGDCNDNNKSINPGVSEIAGNSIDDNCNKQIDEGIVSNSISLTTKKIGVEPQANLSIFVSPNPSSHQFAIVLNSPTSNEVIVLSVYDNLGRLVEVISSIHPGFTYYLGGRYSPGIYHLKAIQGNKVAIIKIVKVSDYNWSHKWK